MQFSSPLHSAPLHRSRAILLIVVSCLLPSCSEARYEGVATFPVTGLVIVDGEPVEGASVKLTPVAGLDQPDSLSARGETDATGVFTLSTYEEGDGAPPGRYAVSIVWLEPADPPRKRDPGPDRLKGKYADPAKSPWQVEVKEGLTDLSPFEIVTEE